MFSGDELGTPDINKIPLASPDEDDEEINIKVTPPPEDQEDKDDDFDYEGEIDKMMEAELDSRYGWLDNDPSWYEYNDKVGTERFEHQKAYIQNMADANERSFEDEVKSNPDKYKLYIRTAEFLERNPNMKPSDLTAAEYRQQIKQSMQNKKANI